MYRQSEKKNLLNSNISSTCSHNMVNIDVDWFEWFASLGHPSKFQRVSSVSFVTAPTSLNRGQPNFARCPALVAWHTICTFPGALAPNGILPRAKFALRPSLAFYYICSVTARHASSGRQPNFAAFSRGCHLYSAGVHHVGHRPTF